ncbi:MAG: T9SS type A sorting domain-containing protein [Calditrichaeota bacterium]|nr:T9SS type A sorting domain-containing protein [Calditrichota bacterium]MCB9391783.1 T9SS type A sorting domain-containing protein [Calditrichota bacterium]
MKKILTVCILLALVASAALAGQTYVKEYADQITALETELAALRANGGDQTQVRIELNALRSKVADLRGRDGVLDLGCADCAPAHYDMGTIGDVVWGYFVAGDLGTDGKWVGSFNGVAGATYHFDLCSTAPGTGTNAGFSSDCDLRIRDAACAVLSYVDGLSGCVPAWSPNDVTWTCPANGVYYVEIKEYNDGTATCTGLADATFDMNYYAVAPPTTPYKCCYGDPCAPTCDDLLEAECLTLGGTYYDGETCAASPCAAPATGDVCCNALPIPGLPFSESGNTCSFNNDYDAVCNFSGGTAPDVAYSFTPAADMTVTFSLCLSGYDTKLYIYDGAPVPGGEIACNDDTPTASCPGASGNFRSYLECVQLYAGHNYCIIVDGYGADCGDYTLTAEECLSTGSCCYSNGAGFCAGESCVDDLLEEDCLALGGVWTRGGTCVDNPCAAVPCVCDCGQNPNSHSVIAADELEYVIDSVIPTTCVTINVPFEYHITDLNVGIDLVHTYDGDIDMYLTSPNGTVIELSTDNGGTGENMTCTVFDDEAAASITTGAAPYSGSWIPETPLSDVDGENALGDWLLCITDDAGGDVGYIIGVCLTFEYDIILPVNFGSISAVAGSGQVTLNWNTLAETNVHHFDVLRNGSKVSEVAATNNATGASYSFVDNGLTNGTTYSYGLVSVDVTGARQELATIEATPTADATVISEYALHQNYPNPFNPTTNIVFDMVDAGMVKISVYNLLGQKVADLANGTYEAGRHVVNFDAAGLSSGLYLYRMEANGFSAQAKMMLMK